MNGVGITVEIHKGKSCSFSILTTKQKVYKSQVPISCGITIVVLSRRLIVNGAFVLHHSFQSLEKLESTCTCTENKMHL